MFVELFGLNIYAKNMNDLINDINKFNKSAILSANPEVIQCIGRLNLNFDDEVIFIPDGIGTVIAAKFLRGIKIKKLAGIDFLLEILKNSHEKQYKIYFLGARPWVVEKAAKRAKEEYNANIVGFHHGYFSEGDVEEVVEDINKTKPDFVFIGLGCPKQEKFIVEYKDKIKSKYLVAVGGSFDVLAGNTKRAPKWMIELGLEWLYRIIRQPIRIIRLNRIAIFLIRVILNL